MTILNNVLKKELDDIYVFIKDTFNKRFQAKQGTTIQPDYVKEASSVAIIFHEFPQLDKILLVISPDEIKISKPDTSKAPGVVPFLEMLASEVKSFIGDVEPPKPIVVPLSERDPE